MIWGWRIGEAVAETDALAHEIEGLVLSDLGELLELLGGDADWGDMGGWLEVTFAAEEGSGVWVQTVYFRRKG